MRRFTRQSFFRISVVAMLVMCIAGHTPNPLDVKLNAIDSALKNLNVQVEKDPNGFFNELHHLPKTFENIKYDPKAKHVTDVVGMLSNFSFLLRDASLKIHPQINIKDDQYSDLLAKASLRYMQSLTAFHGVFAKAAHKRGVRNYGTTFSEIEWLKLTLAETVAFKYIAMSQGMLGKHAGYANGRAMFDFEVPPMVKAVEELKIIARPANEAQYAKLVLFSALNEFTVNRWAVNRLHTAYGWEDTGVNSCAPDLLSFNKTGMLQSLWAPDLKEELEALSNDFRKAAKNLPIASPEFYSKLYRNLVQGSAAVKEKFEKQKPNPIFSASEEEYRENLQYWQQQVDQYYNDTGCLIANNEKLKEENPRHCAAAQASDESTEEFKSSDEYGDETETPPPPKKTKKKKTQSKPETSDVSGLDAIINDYISTSTLNQDVITPEAVTDRLANAIFDARKKAALQAIYMLALQLEVEDLVKVEEQANASIEKLRAAWVGKQRAAIAPIVAKTKEFKFKNSRANERFSKKVTSILGVAQPAMIALTELEEINKLGLGKNDHKEEDVNVMKRQGIPAQFEIAPANPQELLVYYQGKLESPDGKTVAKQLNIQPGLKDAIESYFELVTKDFDKCAKKATKKNPCVLARVAAKAAEFAQDEVAKGNYRFTAVAPKKKTGKQKKKSKQAAVPTPTPTPILNFMNLPNQRSLVAQDHARYVAPRVEFVDPKKVFAQALDLIHMNRRAAAPNNPATRAWKEKPITFSSPLSLNRFDPKLTEARRDATTYVPKRQWIPPQPDPASLDSFSNRDLKAEELTNRDFIRTIFDHRVYAESVIAIAYSKSAMLRIEFEKPRMRLSSDPTMREEQVRAYNATRQLQINLEASQSRQQPQDKRSKKKGSSNPSSTSSSSGSLNYIYKNPGIDSLTIAGYMPDFKNGRKADWGTHSLLDHLATAYDRRSKTVNMTIVEQKVGQAAGIAFNEIKGKLEDFCQVNVNNYADDEKFKLMYESASASRFALIEFEQDRDLAYRMKQFDESIRKKIRSWFQATLEDYANPILNEIFWPMLILGVAVLVLACVPALAGAAGALLPVFGPMLYTMNVLGGGATALALICKLPYQFYEMPRIIGYHNSIAQAQIEGYVADPMVARMQREQMADAQKWTIYLLPLDLWYAGSTGKGLVKDVLRKLGYVDAAFIARTTSLEVQTRATWARKTGEITQKYAPFLEKNWIPEFVRRPFNALLSKGSNVGKRLLQSIPKYQANFSRDELQRALRIAVMREMPNNPSVFLPELDRYGSYLEKKIQKYMTKFFDETGIATFEDFTRDPQRVIYEMMERTAPEALAEKSGQLIGENARLMRSLKKAAELMTKYRRFQALKLKIHSTSALADEGIDIAVANQAALNSGANPNRKLLVEHVEMNAREIDAERTIFNTEGKAAENAETLWREKPRVDVNESEADFGLRRHFVDQLEEDDLALLLEAARGGSVFQMLKNSARSTVQGAGPLRERMEFLARYFEAKQNLKPIVRNLIDPEDPSAGVFLSFKEITAEKAAYWDITYWEMMRKKNPKAQQVVIDRPDRLLSQYIGDYYQQYPKQLSDDGRRIIDAVYRDVSPK